MLIINRYNKWFTGNDNNIIISYYYIIYKKVLIWTGYEADQR